MLLTCDNCQTIFRIDDSAISATGQHVRCSVCEHVWHVAAPASDTDLTHKNILTDTFKTLRIPAFLLIALMVISTVLFAFRGPLTASYPQLITTYQLLGLQIEPDLELLQVIDLNAAYNVNVLRIRGNLINNASLPAHASALQVVVSAADGKVLAQENIMPESKFLNAGEKTPFFVQVELANAEDARIVVTPISGKITKPQP